MSDDFFAEEEFVIEDSAKVAKEQFRQVFLATAQDTGFFCHMFFPKTFRQESPPYAKQLYAVAEDPEISHAMLLIFRGGSKTTQAKGILAKRLSFGISRTMLLVSQSQDHSIRTLTWLRKQIETNTKWTTFFKLSPAMSPSTGRPVKWTDEWLCIRNEMYNTEINIVAAGITGQTRGINIDDYRPDFILGDDIADDQNSLTPAPQQAVINTWTGAIEKSLAPKSENPLAKILLLQTPIHEDDVVASIQKDPRYAVFRMPIFVEDAEGNPQSAWPARWSTEELLRDKDAHIQAGKLRMWMREMELAFVDGDRQLLPSSWLEWYDTLPDLTKGFVVVAVDPTPPPKLGGGKAVNDKLDDTAVLALYFSPTERLVLERKTVKSPSSGVIMDLVFDMVKTWRPFKVAVETVLFARTIAMDILKEQSKRQVFFAIHPVEDKRKKVIRICTEIGNWCGDLERVAVERRKIGLLSGMNDIYTQWNGYTGNDSQHDDLLDALSIALMVGEQFVASLGAIDGEWTHVTDDAPLEQLTFEDAAP